jgi:SCP-2 sterol transfer family
VYLRDQPAACSASNNAASHVIMLWLADSEWTLDLRPDETPSLVDGPPKTEPDLRVTINDDNFANLVAGKLGQQKVGFG